MTRRRWALAIALAVALLAAPGVAAGAGFSAHGSVGQVYVTGLRSHQRMVLANQHGRRIATKRADSLGGLLFRNVRPGRGYRVRLLPHGLKSGPLRVFTTRSAPPSLRVYNQTIPSSGYGYLTTRDGTKLAIDVHTPIAPAGA